MGKVANKSGLMRKRGVPTSEVYILAQLLAASAHSYSKEWSGWTTSPLRGRAAVEAKGAAEENMSELKVGKFVDAWCSRCGFMLSHTIEAMVGDTIKRVHCNTCNTQHAFRAHAPGEGPSQPRASRSSDDSRPRKSGGAGLARASDFDTLMQGRDISTPRRYSPKQTFAPHDVIDHPTFGIGLVTGLKDSHKVEILFRTGAKVLIHGKG